MRLRTVVSFASGAAAGAGWMYLADPDHGSDRRRQLRRDALRGARRGALALASEARRRAEEFAYAAVAGYEQGRVESRQEAAPSTGLRVVGAWRADDSRGRTTRAG
jgi:hypothetical protein